MKEVSIFLWIHPNAPRAREIKYKYILVFGPHTRTGEKTVSGETANRVLMMAAIAALERMTKPAMITFWTESDYFINGHEHMAEWIRNGWKRSGGKELKNADLWKRLHELECVHSVRCIKDTLNQFMGD